MRFRCTMDDAGNMRDFTNIVTTVARMSRSCVVRLTENEICFNVSDDAIPIIWVELSQEHYFNSYVMEGVTEDFPNIYFECETNLLAKALAQLKQNAKSVKFKLTKKQQPCFTVEVSLPSLSDDIRLCVHDIPIKMIPRKDWCEYHAPDIPEFDISIDMPNLKDVRKIVERMRNLAPRLTLTAENTGTLIFKVESEKASVSTYFSNLQVHKRQQNDEAVTASVDVKKFCNFLSWDLLQPQIVHCNVLDERMINLHIRVDNHLRIHYFIPAVAL